MESIAMSNQLFTVPFPTLTESSPSSTTIVSGISPMTNPFGSSTAASSELNAAKSEDGNAKFSDNNASVKKVVPTVAASAKAQGQDGKKSTEKKAKARKRVNTAEKRASHNAVERQRREVLNGRFLDLARLLPTLANLRRPSKSAIVNASISHLTHQRAQRLLAAKELRALFSENQEILAELNEWRAKSGVAAKEVNGWTEGMEEIMTVENETFGNFTGMGDGDENGEGEDGENDGEGSVGFGGDQDGDDQGENEMSRTGSAPFIGVDEASFIAAAAASATSGLHTPTGNVGIPDVYSLNGFNGVNFNFNGFPAMPTSAAAQQIAFVATSDAGSSHGDASPNQFATANSASFSSSAATFMGGSFDAGTLTPNYGLSTYPATTATAAPSPHGSIGALSGSGVVTPPPVDASQDLQANISTFAPSPPTVPTSFSIPHNGTPGEKVSDWTSQQLMFQLAAAGGAASQTAYSEGMVAAMTEAKQKAQQQAMLSNMAFMGGNGVYHSNFNAAQQTLLANHPQLAAAVYPPALQTGENSPTPAAARQEAAAAFTAALRGNLRAGQNAQGFLTTPVPNAMADGMGMPSLDFWRKKSAGIALPTVVNGSVPPTINQLREAVKAGMQMGMGMGWNQAGFVEGAGNLSPGQTIENYA